jgi:hypothetical protein
VADETEEKVIKVVSFIDPHQLKKDLAYSMANLSDAMSQQASLFAHYGGLAAKSSRQADQLDLYVDTTEAAVYRMLKDGIVAAGEKVVVADLDRQVKRHPRVIKARQAHNKAKQIESMAKTAVEAFRHRRDMLIQQGLISREEMKGELSIVAKREGAAHIEDLKERVMARQRAKSEDAA